MLAFAIAFATLSRADIRRMGAIPIFGVTEPRRSQRNGANSFSA
jgi:hypothetical protein